MSMHYFPKLPSETQEHKVTTNSITASFLTYTSFIGSYGYYLRKRIQLSGKDKQMVIPKDTVTELRRKRRGFGRGTEF